MVGVEYSQLWSRSAENAGDAVDSEDEDGDPLEVVRLGSHFCAAETRETAGSSPACSRVGDRGHMRQIVRSDGEAAFISLIKGAMLTAMADGPYEFILLKTSKGQSSGSGLTEGVVNEVTAKIGTLTYVMWKMLKRAVSESHDVPAWLVQHAPATFNSHRTGTDGRTPFHRRAGKRFGRVVAPFGQKVRCESPMGLNVGGEKASSWGSSEQDKARITAPSEEEKMWSAQSNFHQRNLIGTWSCSS